MRRIFYKLIFLGIGMLLPFISHAQLKTVQISSSGNITIENKFTSDVLLPFNEVIYKFTDNTYALNKIPRDSISTDSTFKEKKLAALFTFDEHIYFDGNDSKEDEYLLIKNDDDYNYSYGITHFHGCGSGGAWHESETFQCRLIFSKNKLKRIEWKRYKDRKSVSDTAYFDYKKSGVVKRIKLTSGETFNFTYDKQQNIVNIEKRHSHIKNTLGQDSTRMIFGNYKFGKDQYIYNESIYRYRYYQAYDEKIATKKEIKKYNTLRNKYLEYNAAVDLAYEKVERANKKIDKMDDRLSDIEDKLESYFETLPSEPRLFYKKYNEHGKLVRIDEIDFDGYGYIDDYEMRDSFNYDNKQRLIKHTRYYEYGSGFIKEFKYNNENKLSELIRYDIDEYDKKITQTFLLKYNYDTLGRMATINRTEFYKYADSNPAYTIHFFY